jgi:hypothetical protein
LESEWNKKRSGYNLFLGGCDEDVKKPHPRQTSHPNLFHVQKLTFYGEWGSGPKITSFYVTGSNHSSITGPKIRPQRWYFWSRLHMVTSSRIMSWTISLIRKRSTIWGRGLTFLRGWETLHFQLLSVGG